MSPSATTQTPHGRTAQDRREARPALPVTRRPSLTEGLSYAGLSFGFSVVLAVATSIVTARIYGIEVVGEFALATAPVSALWFLSTVRERPAFVRLVATMAPRAPRLTGLFVAVFAFSTALTLVAALLATGGTYLLYEGAVDQPDLFLPALAGIVGYVLLTNPGWNLDAVFVAFGDGRRLFLIRGHQSLVLLVLLVGFSFVLPSVWGPVLATIGSWIPTLVHRILAVRVWMGARTSRADIRAGFRELPEMIRFGLKLTPGALAVGVGGQASIWVLGAVSTVSAVGAYTRASMVSGRFGEVNQRIREILFPALVRRRADGDREAFDRALIDSIRYSMVGLMLPAAVLGGASVAVMGVFGPAFTFAAPALAITMVRPALMGTNGMRVAAIMAIDKPLSVTYARMGSVVAKLVAIVPFTLAWGITGTAVASLLMPIAANMWMNLIIRKHLGLKPTQLFPPRQTLSIVVAYGAGFGAAALLQDVLPQPLGLLVALVGGTAAYVATYVGIGGPTERDRARFRAIATRLRRERRRRRARVARTA